MACPICITPEGTAIAAGVRAGGSLLIIVTAIVIGCIGRFAWRLWSLRLVAVTETVTPPRSGQAAGHD